MCRGLMIGLSANVRFSLVRREGGRATIMLRFRLRPLITILDRIMPTYHCTLRCLTDDIHLTRVHATSFSILFHSTTFYMLDLI